MMMHACARGIFHNDAKSAAHTLTPLECLHPCRHSLLCISMEREEFLFFALPLDVIALLLSHFPQFVVALPSHAQKLAFARTSMMHAARQTVQLRNCSHLERAPASYNKGAIAIANIGATSCLSALHFAILKNRLLDRAIWEHFLLLLFTILRGYRKILFQ